MKETPTARKTLGLMKKNWKLVFLIALSDIMFILITAFFSSAVFDKMLDYILAASSLIASKSAELGSIVAQSPTFFQAIASVEGADLYIYDTILLALILLFGIYVFYSLFQGFSWYLAGRIAGKKKDYYSFMKHFLIINLVWILAYALYRLLDIFISFRNLVAERPYSPGALNLSFILPLLAFIIIYFMIVSYSRIFSRKKLLKLPSLRHFTTYVYASIIIIIIHMLQVFAFRYSIIISGILFLLLEVPAFTFARLQLIDEKK